MVSPTCYRRSGQADGPAILSVFVRPDGIAPVLNEPAVSYILGAVPPLRRDTSCGLSSAIYVRCRPSMVPVVLSDVLSGLSKTASAVCPATFRGTPPEHSVAELRFQGGVLSVPCRRCHEVHASRRRAWHSDLSILNVQVSRISVVGLTYLAKSSLSVAVSRSMHDKYVRITKPHHSAKWLQHTSTVSGVICQKADFRTFLPWSAHSAWHRL